MNLDQKTGAFRVDRAIFELRRGRPVEVQDTHGTSVFAVIERLDPNDLKDFISPDGEVRLAITPEGVRTLGFSESEQALVVASIERKIQLDQARPRYDRYSRTGS